MSLSACDGTVLVSGLGRAFNTGFGPVTKYVCMPADLNGLVVDVGGGLFPEETSWTIMFPSGEVQSGSNSGVRRLMCPVECEGDTAVYKVELSDSFGDG